MVYIFMLEWQLSLPMHLAYYNYNFKLP